MEKTIDYLLSLHSEFEQYESELDKDLRAIEQMEREMNEKNKNNKKNSNITNSNSSNKEKVISNEEIIKKIKEEQKKPHQVTKVKLTTTTNKNDSRYSQVKSTDIEKNTSNLYSSQSNKDKITGITSVSSEGEKKDFGTRFKGIIFFSI
jgi:hypothetical protein